MKHQWTVWNVLTLHVGPTIGFLTVRKVLAETIVPIAPHWRVMLIVQPCEGFPLEANGNLYKCVARTPRTPATCAMRNTVMGVAGYAKSRDICDPCNLRNA